MAEIKRLAGKDGKVYLAQRSAIVTGDGATKLTKGNFYVPLTIASSGSGFPAGVTKGIVFVATGDETPTATETYINLSLAPQCDITSANVEFEKEELDQTTLCDTYHVYNVGMTDISGTLEGIMTLGKSEVLLAKFIPVQQQDENGAITTINQNDDAIIIVLELNKADNSDAVLAYLFAPAVITTNGDNVAVGENQTFSANFRIAQDNDIKAAFIEADKALFNIV